LNPAAWRKFAQQPGGVLMTLLLVVLLAFGGRLCPMSAFAAPSPTPDPHGCCRDSGATPDKPADPLPSSCHDGPCLQANGHHVAADRHGPPADTPDWPPPPLAVAGLLPPDWLSNGHSLPSLAAETTGPLPPQRSIVLRL
jgi:hypothetical protein